MDWVAHFHQQSSLYIALRIRVAHNNTAYCWLHCDLSYFWPLKPGRTGRRWSQHRCANFVLQLHAEGSNNRRFRLHTRVILRQYGQPNAQGPQWLTNDTLWLCFRLASTDVSGVSCRRATQSASSKFLHCGRHYRRCIKFAPKNLSTLSGRTS
jgi:hypothetical protein